MSAVTRLVDTEDHGALAYADGMVYALTPCCKASGKGLVDEESGEGYVGCRSCYREVDWAYGLGFFVGDLTDEQITDELSWFPAEIAPRHLFPSIVAAIRALQAEEKNA